MVSKDLPKAFDTIPHGLLLAKVRAYGLSDSACELFRDYLPGRLQRVKVGDTYSERQSVKRGVPQGSVLGTTHILWVGGGSGFWGVHPKIFELKGEPPQKLRGKGGHAGICTGLRGGHSRENRGDAAKFFRDNLKFTVPPTHKNEWSLRANVFQYLHKRSVLSYYLGEAEWIRTQTTISCTTPMPSIMQWSLATQNTHFHFRSSHQ